MADEEAVALLTLAGAPELVPALCHLETGNGVVTRSLVENIGLGVGGGLVLAECATETQAAPVRRAYAAAIMAVDGRRFARISRMKLKKDNTHAAVLKRATALVVGYIHNLVKELKKQRQVEGGVASGGGGTVHVALQSTEEDRQYSKHDYEAATMQSGMQLVKRLFHVRLRGHEMAALGMLKRMAHAILVEGSFADPDRIPLEKMRRTPGDSAYTLYRRWLNGHLVVAAGVKVWEGVRDEGAGDMKGGEPQFLNGIVVEDHLKELDESRDTLTDQQMKEVTMVMQKVLHKSTTSGGESGSLAISKLTGRATEIIGKYTG